MGRSFAPWPSSWIRLKPRGGPKLPELDFFELYARVSHGRLLAMKSHTYSEPEGGDQSQGWALLSVCWAFVLCAALTTVSRVWVRAKLTRNLGWDDYTILITLVSPSIS